MEFIETVNYKTIEPPATVGMHSYPGDMQGCGHIRVIFPALLVNTLRLPGYRCHASYSSTFVNDLRFYKAYTFVIFQRAATDHHLHLVEHFLNTIRKNMKTPMIYEIDDLLWGIPEWNRAATFYHKCKDSIEKLMSRADGMTVSTNKLKEIYSKFNQNITVIPNHLPKFLWGEARLRLFHPFSSDPKHIKPRILYQGSDNHFCTKILQKQGLKGGDFGDELINFIKKTMDKYTWVFMGGYPLELDEFKCNGKIEYHNWKGSFDYPNYIKSIEPDLCIAPLKQNLFNESKSNIKNLEYVAIGSPAIYSDIEPYKHCTVKVKTDEEMIAEIERLIDKNNIDLRKQVWEKDYEAVKEQIFWEDYNNVFKYVNLHLMLFKKRLKDV